MAAHHRIFTSFAIEDDHYRDLLVGQAKNEKSPFSFTDMSVKEPWDEKWKTNCTTKIKGCDGLIAIVTSNLRKGEGALWEIRCAKEQRIPILGLYAQRDNKPTLPSELTGQKVIEWSWPGIGGWLKGL